MIPSAKCKITVIKKTVNQDLIDLYMTDPLKSSRPCSKFQEGDVFFVTSEFSMPENFCQWAWADLRKEILAIINGVSYSWYRSPGTAIACCTDWFKPVYFKIERRSSALVSDEKNI